MDAFLIKECSGEYSKSAYISSPYMGGLRLEQVNNGISFWMSQYNCYHGSHIDLGDLHEPLWHSRTLTGRLVTTCESIKYFVLVYRNAIKLFGNNKTY